MEYNYTELMVCSAAREIKDGDKLLVGVGFPYVAAILAKMMHAPNLCILFELGVYDSQPIDPSIGAADPRSWYRATKFSGFLEVIGMIVHRGRLDCGVLGALEVDQYGNINSTQLTQNGKIKHFNGSGGANDIATLGKSTLVVSKHDKRKLKETIEYITSPGFLQGGTSRRDAGIKGGGVSRVITDKAVFSVEETTKRLKLLSIHPGITAENIIENTGFAVDVKDVPLTTPPSETELKLIREVIDPQGLYTGEKK
ncbi:MAG: CoA-transferase [Peptococcaceae bacterium]|jgi:acyl CoA:acetate/3-ketoacid CoA transferase beta subunit|nr:CoA-transferase [Peptococcaceae bacterium]